MCIEHRQSTPVSAKCNIKTSSYLIIRLFTLPIARSNDTHHLCDKLCWHWLSPILKAKSTTRWKPRLWPKSSQWSTLVPKVSLGGEEKQQWCHVPCTTDVWRCRWPLAHALCYRWFVSSLSNKSKCPMWPPTQQLTLLAIECVQMSMPLDNHDDRDCHNNCDVSTHAQDFCPIATE